MASFNSAAVVIWSKLHILYHSIPVAFSFHVTGFDTAKGFKWLLLIKTYQNGMLPWSQHSCHIATTTDLMWEAQIVAEKQHVALLIATRS